MSFSELYLIYYPKLVRFAKEFVMSEEDAENITQDVFTDLWEKRESMNQYECLSFQACKKQMFGLFKA